MLGSVICARGSPEAICAGAVGWAGSGVCPGHGVCWHLDGGLMGCLCATQSRTRANT